MGLLQAGIGALSGVLADQWREYFYCEGMPENVLAVKGVKRTSGRSSNYAPLLQYQGRGQHHLERLHHRCE